MDSLLPNRARLKPPLLTASVVFAVTSSVGCAEPPAVVETPQSRFVARGVRITELRPNGVAWRGTVAEASGDLELTRVTDVTLTRPPATPDEPPLVLEAPRGLLDFAAGTATLEPILIRRGGGSELTASAAVYREAEQRVDVSGPLELTAPGFVAQAASAVLHLDTRSVELSGPVRGRWTP